jgi:hypothetical protein
MTELFWRGNLKNLLKRSKELYYLYQVAKSIQPLKDHIKEELVEL